MMNVAQVKQMSGITPILQKSSAETLGGHISPREKENITAVQALKHDVALRLRQGETLCRGPR